MNVGRQISIDAFFESVLNSKGGSISTNPCMHFIEQTDKARERERERESNVQFVLKGIPISMLFALNGCKSSDLLNFRRKSNQNEVKQTQFE